MYFHAKTNSVKVDDENAYRTLHLHTFLLMSSCSFPPKVGDSRFNSDDRNRSQSTVWWLRTSPSSSSVHLPLPRALQVSTISSTHAEEGTVIEDREEILTRSFFSPDKEKERKAISPSKTWSPFHHLLVCIDLMTHDFACIEGPLSSPPFLILSLIGKVWGFVIPYHFPFRPLHPEEPWLTGERMEKERWKVTHIPHHAT